jgi:hypothetical protein
VKVTEGLPSWIRRWATLLDSRFRIPGTNIRFGIDPILSLIPGLGDLASPVFTAALLAQSFRQRVPKVVILRMLFNALIDAAIGAIPIAGQLGDIFFRSNVRNLALLERHADPARRPERGDYVFVMGVLVAFGFVVALPVILAIWLASRFWQAVSP